MRIKEAPYYPSTFFPKSSPATTVVPAPAVAAKTFKTKQIFINW